MLDSTPAELPSQGAHEDATLAGRRQPLRPPPTLENAQSASIHWDPNDEREQLRTGELRVVNETRQRLDSVPGYVGTPSSIPVGGSVQDLYENRDRKARWRDSADISNTKKNAVPVSFHDQAVDVLIKIRLIPIMKILKGASDKDILAQAAERALAVVEFAVANGASEAILGRCSYYLGVAQALLGDKEAKFQFIGALSAKGVYEEGRWASQWLNHYDNVAELSPKRIANSDRPTSLFGSFFSYWTGPSHKDDEKLPEQELTEDEKLREKVQSKFDAWWQPLTPGVLGTTPVKNRFSLDVREDVDEGNNSGSDSDRKSTSIVPCGDRIPSFSTWVSQESSKTAQPASLKRYETTQDSHSPRSAPVSPTQQSSRSGNGHSTSISFDSSSQFSPRDLRRSGSFTKTALEPDDEDTLRHRRKSSVAESIMKKVRGLSIISSTKSTEQLMEEGHSPGFEPEEHEKELYRK